MEAQKKHPIDVELTGFRPADETYAPENMPVYDFTLFNPKNLKNMWRGIRNGRYFPSLRYLKTGQDHSVKMYNAREKEAEEGLSKSEFFNKYGFVLLEHKTAMKEEDWKQEVYTTDQAAIDYTAETVVSRVYKPEIESLTRMLLPDYRILVCPNFITLRGKNTPNPEYGLGIHQDFGVTDEHFKHGADPQWLQVYDKEKVEGFMIINYWRAVAPMKGPIIKTPLAVLDPNTVSMEDVMPKKMFGFGNQEKGDIQLSLKHSPNHKWYYYPNMTKDEVLVFKQFQHFKSQDGPKITCCFHTAFKTPYAPADAEERISTEYRVMLWFDKNIYADKE